MNSARPDPATRRFLDRIAALGLPPMSALGPAGARQAMLDARVNDVAPPPVAHVEDRTIPGPGGALRVRCYRPREAGGATPGALAYFHGGGFVIGDLDTHDTICRRLCLGGDVVVLSVDYRLAPEHRFPAAVDDALAALEWLHANAASLGADPQRLAVGGDSAGGTLAAVAAQHARDQGIALRAQILHYPVVDLSRPHPSQDEHASTPPIPREVLDWFWSLYLGEDWAGNAALRGDPRVSPLCAPGFEGLAPAFVLTAGLDPLRDEGLAYAARLAAAGVETVYHCAMGTVHGFLRLGAVVPAAGDALAGVAGFLRPRMALE